MPFGKEFTCRIRECLCHILAFYYCIRGGTKRGHPISQRMRIEESEKFFYYVMLKLCLYPLEPYPLQHGYRFSKSVYVVFEHRRQNPHKHYPAYLRHFLTFYRAVPLEYTYLFEAMRTPLHFGYRNDKEPIFGQRLLK